MLLTTSPLQIIIYIVFFVTGIRGGRTLAQLALWRVQLVTTLARFKLLLLLLLQKFFFFFFFLLFCLTATINLMITQLRNGGCGWILRRDRVCISKEKDLQQWEKPSKIKQRKEKNNSRLSKLSEFISRVLLRVHVCYTRSHQAIASWQVNSCNTHEKYSFTSTKKL
jgi:hypothetical protein